MDISVHPYGLKNIKLLDINWTKSLFVGDCFFYVDFSDSLSFVYREKIVVKHKVVDCQNVLKLEYAHF